MIKQLIITGDDYGLCAPVNEAIEECLAAGTMGATCVMTNMPACDEAVTLRRKFPGKSIGLHWNITQGRPLLDPVAVPSLVDGNGQFVGPLRQRWLTGRVSRAEIRAELAAQHKRFEKLAGSADFWNTHQNVHVFPGLFQLFVALGKELKIPAMRSHARFTLPAVGSVGAYHVRHPGYWLKGHVIRRWSNEARAAGTRLPDGRLYLPGYQPGSYTLTALVERIPWRDVHAALELVIHPAKALDENLFGGLTDSRLREYETFRNPTLVGRLKQSGVRLVGFDALGGNSSKRKEQAA